MGSQRLQQHIQIVCLSSQSKYESVRPNQDRRRVMRREPTLKDLRRIGHAPTSDAGQNLPGPR
jgi:hypothetical protein